MDISWASQRDRRYLFGASATHNTVTIVARSGPVKHTPKPHELLSCGPGGF
jgi:hypothetical protein